MFSRTSFLVTADQALSRIPNLGLYLDSDTSASPLWFRAQARPVAVISDDQESVERL
jgi:hypothetical protein